MFKTGQYGKLYFQSSSHARGNTFRIWILPTTETIHDFPWKVEGAVEVYGITGGQPGWTETYGWLHEGKWQQDFYEIVEARELQIKQEMDEKRVAQEEKDRQQEARVKKLLESY